MADSRRRFVDTLLKQSLDRLASASRVLYVWLVALVLVWIVQMEPTQRTLLELASNEGRLRDTEAQVVGIRPDDPAFGAVNERLRQQQDTVQPAREQAETITFELPGFGGELPVPTQYAALIWQGLALGLLFFIASTRRLLLRSAARAGRILVNELRLPPDEFRGHAGAPHWWMYPLPNRDGVEARADVLTLLYDQPQRAGSAIVLLFFAALLLIQARVLWIGLLATMLLTSGVERVLLRSASVGLLVTTVCLMVRWFTPRRVPDSEPDEPDPNVVTRRQWLGYGAAIAGGVALVATAEAVRTEFGPIGPIAPDPTPVPRVRRPRYRPKRGPISVKTGLASGWQRNRRSQTIHYVTPDGTIRTHGAINEKNFEPVSTAQVLSDKEHALQVSRDYRSFSFEQASLSALQAGRIDEACRLLVNGIQRVRAVTPPDYRLYDLLAAISARQRRPTYLNEVVAVGKGHPRPDLFEARIRRWTDVNGKWHKRWTASSSKPSWSGLPM